MVVHWTLFHRGFRWWLSGVVAGSCFCGGRDDLVPRLWWCGSNCGCSVEAILVVAVPMLAVPMLGGSSVGELAIVAVVAVVVCCCVAVTFGLGGCLPSVLHRPTMQDYMVYPGIIVGWFQW
jgi:hypothetical protein